MSKTLSHWAGWRYFALLGLSLIGSALFSEVQAACSASDIGGMVYRDFNANGTQDANEPGFGATGMRVAAYNTANLAVKTVAVNADGSYLLAGLGDGSPYRLEFTGLPSYLEYGAAGSTKATGVQFVTGSACQVNVAVNNAANYCQANPLLAVPRLDAGTGVGNTLPGLFTFPYNDSGSQASGDGNSNNRSNVHATVEQLGSVYGVGWQRHKKRLFVSSYLRRHIGFADGPGFVYAFDFESAPSGYSKKFDLQGVAPANGGAAINLGGVTRTHVAAAIANGAAGDYQISATPTAPTRDLDAYGKVTKMSYGDIEVGEDGKTLWLMNLYQRALISVDISGDTTALPGTVKQYPLAGLPGSPVCSKGEFRPWALTFHDGKGYLGGICDASSGTYNDLKGIVMAFDPVNVAAGLTQVLDIPLSGNRASGDHADSVGEYHYYNWEPWTDTWTEPPVDSLPDGSRVYVHPVLSDLEFLADGSLVIGLRDRFGDEVGKGYKALSGSKLSDAAFTFGDMRMACNVNGTLHLEGPKTDPLCPGKFVSWAGDNWEYFSDLSGDGNEEGFSGALAYSPVFNDIVSTMVDPQPPANNGNFVAAYAVTAGIHKNNIKTGVQSDWYQVLDSDYNTLHKSNALGDLEMLCDEAPIEVGNRVWLDANANGIQDADEVGIDGVSVTLACGLDTAATTTANGGQFLFSNAAGGNATFMVDGESCILRVNGSQTAVQAYSLTTANADGQTTNDSKSDLRDSDAIDKVGLAEVLFTVGSGGENNHTLDIGYKNAPAPEVDIALTKSVSPAMAKRGETVVYTLTVSNQGTGAGSGITVKDLLPPEVVFISDDGQAQYGQDVYDEVTGMWSVGSLAAGVSRTLSITVLIK